MTFLVQKAQEEPSKRNYSTYIMIHLSAVDSGDARMWTSDIAPKRGDWRAIL